MSATPRILIVEDDAVMVAELQDTLTEMGYQVVGLAAVESAYAQKPDLFGSGSSGLWFACSAEKFLSKAIWM